MTDELARKLQALYRERWGGDAEHWEYMGEDYKKVWGDLAALAVKELAPVAATHGAWET